jgi:hypothetical protein
LCSRNQTTSFAGNDDSCGAQSRISIASATQRFVYVVVSGYSGAVGNYQLNWNYVLVSLQRIYL